MPLRPDFYWYTRPLPEYDLRRRLKGFETRAEVEERSASLCRVLEKGGRKHKRLAKSLRRCRKDERCCLIPCPRCRRRYRLWLVGEMLRLWEGRKGLSFVTLIPPDLRVAEGELEGFEPKRFTERVKRQLQRAGLGEITVVVGLIFPGKRMGAVKGVCGSRIST